MISELQAGVRASMPQAAASPAAAPAAHGGDVAKSPSANTTPIPKAEIKVDTERMKQNLQEAISRLNDMVRDGGRGLSFSMDDKLGRPVVYVKNAETGEVVRQIPNEVVVRLAHSIESFKGILHNDLA
jgi:flagellar protein FlaG